MHRRRNVRSVIAIFQYLDHWIYNRLWAHARSAAHTPKSTVRGVPRCKVIATMARDKETNILIDKLTFDNYATWSPKLEFLLKSKKLHQYLLTPGTGDKLPEDEAAQGIIGLYVGDVFLPHLAACNTAKACWDKLKSLFERSNKARLASLNRDMSDLRMLPKETISNYFSRAINLGLMLKSAGKEMSEKDIILQLLTGMPEEYDTVRSILLTTTSDADFTFENVQSHMLQVEHRIQKLSTSGSPQVALHTHVNKGNTQRPGRFGKETRKCHYCKKPGHLIADCRKKKADEARSTGAGSNPIALAACVKIVDHVPFDGWVLDSGATDHITNDITDLTNIKFFKPDEAPTLTTLEGTSSPIMAQGMVILTRSVTSNRRIVLEDVLYSPSASVKLLSITRATQKGAQFQFANDTCYMYFGGNLMAVAERMSGLYVFRSDVYRNCTALWSSTTDNSSSADNMAQLWHRRFGHVSFDTLARMPAMVTGLTGLTPAHIQDARSAACEPCFKGKQTRLPFGDSDTVTTKPLELIHMDLCGPMETPTVGGKRYMATFLDDYTNLSVVVLLSNKHEMYNTIISTCNLLETQSGGYKVQRVRTDNGGEYVSNALTSWLESRGILHQLTVPYTPQQNGKAERLNRTIMDKVRSMLADAHLPKELWGEATSTANYLRNRTPASGMDKTPWELFFNKKPDVSDLRVFGAKAYTHVPDQLRTKLSAKSCTGIMVGYGMEKTKGYRIYMPDTHKVQVSRDVVFDEGHSVSQAVTGVRLPMPASTSLDDYDDYDDCNSNTFAPRAAAAPVGQQSSDQPLVSPAVLQPPVQSPVQPPMQAPAAPQAPVPVARRLNLTPLVGPQPEQPIESEPESESESAQDQPELTAAQQAINEAAITGTKITRRGHTYFTTVTEPTTYQQAVSGKQSELWKNAMDEEMASLLANKTWTLSYPPDGIKPIPVKWVYKVKCTPEGEIERFKARVVAKGFKQEEGINYTEVFSPVSKYSTLRAVIAKVSIEDLHLHQLDIKTAFLQADLEEDVYIQQPMGYNEGDPNLACHLHKAIYGLKQAPRAWYLLLDQELKARGFHVSSADPGLYVFTDPVDGQLYLLVYVDDILLAAKSEKLIHNIKQAVLSKFEGRDLGPASGYLGINITRKDGSILLSNPRMITELATQYGMSSSNARHLPMSVGTDMSAGSPALDMSKFPYRQLVGSLMHLAVTVRPDIAFAVGSLARFMSAPTQQHWNVAKGVLRYLIGTPSLGIRFVSGASDLTGYCDADFAADVVTRRSTTGYVFLLGGGAITWQSKRQPTVAASTTEAEYQAAAAAVKEALWLRKVLHDLRMPTRSVSILIDNQSALKLLYNPVSSARTKHIDVVHHLARERAIRKEVEFSYVHTADQVADAFTKPLPISKHMFCCKSMGMA